jgi:hypothetical protein
MHPGANCLDVGAGSRRVKFHRFGQIHLRNDRKVCTVEDSGIFQGLVLPFGDRHANDAKVFAEAKASQLRNFKHAIPIANMGLIGFVSQFLIFSHGFKK